MIGFLKKTYYQLIHSTYLKNLIVLTSGVGFSQLIPLLLLPILTRFFSPLDFGLLAIFMAIIQVLALTSTFRLEMAVILPKKDVDAVILCVISFILLLVVSLFVFFILLLFYNHINHFIALNFQISNFMIYLIPVGGVLLGTYNILYNWNNRLELYKNMSYSHIAHSIVSTPISILFYFTPLKGLGLILGQIIGRCLACFFLLNNIIQSIKDLIDLDVDIFDYSFLVLKKYKNFVLFETPQSILNFLSHKYIIGVFATIFSLSNIGIFDLADKIIGKPLSIISNSFKTIFYKRLTTAQDKIKVFRNSIMLMTMISIILTFPFYILPDSFFIVLLGEEWSDTGRYIQLICPLLFARFTFNVVVPSISYTLRNQYLLIWQLVYFMCLVLLFWVFKTLDVESVLLIYALFGAFMYMLLGSISFFVLKKNIKN